VQKRTKVNQRQPCEKCLREAKPSWRGAQEAEPKSPQQGKHGRLAAHLWARDCCAQDLPKINPSAS
ncbi:hypothetical protein A2U01_0106709, partial [Trifolium medium]|nr:hypothetical protein [Trifolium medium]